LLRSLIYGVTDWPLDKMVSMDIPNGLPIVYRPEDGSLHVLAKDGKMQYWGRAGGECPLSTESTESTEPRPTQPATASVDPAEPAERDGTFSGLRRFIIWIV
jgi:hypothetical protein